MMLRALCLIAALTFPAAASAKPFSFDGTLSGGVTDRDGGRPIGLVDVMLTISLPTEAPLAAEIGTYLFALESKRPHETYIALVYDNRWRVGAVRPAYDAVLPSVFTRAAPFLAYERAEYTRAYTTVEAMRATAVPYSLAWQDSFGRTDLALSVHDANKGDFRSVAASVRYRGNGWSVAAAIEPAVTSDGDRIGANAKLGGRVDVGDGSVGAALLRADANDRPDALALDVEMPVTETLDLLAFGEFTDAGQDDAYGVGMGYRIRPDSTVFASVTDGEEGRAMHLSLEYSF